MMMLGSRVAIKSARGSAGNDDNYRIRLPDISAVSWSATHYSFT
jgi:hypothetical protein